MNAMAFTLLQAVSAMITVVLISQFKTTTSWLCFIFAFSLAHYFLAVYYSRHNIVAKTKKSSTWIPLIVLAAIGSYLYNTAFPLILYFGIHHIINDVYTRFHHADPTQLNVNKRLIICSALLCNGLGLLAILHGSEQLFGLPNRNWLITLFLVSLASHILLLVKQTLAKQSLAKQTVAEKSKFMFTNVSSELLYLCFIPVSFAFKIQLYHVICYHAVFWTLLPLFKFNKTQNLKYIALTALAIGGWLAVSPIGFRDTQIPFKVFMAQFTLWSYIHITLAFATSNAHPNWINRIFGNKVHG